MFKISNTKSENNVKNLVFVKEFLLREKPGINFQSLSLKNILKTSILKEFVLFN